MAHLSSGMIDKQYRTAGRLFKLIGRPSERGFRFLHRMLGSSAGKNMDGADSSTVMVARSDGEGAVRVRVFRPINATNLPILIYLHGGGYAIGMPDQDNYLKLFRQLMDTRPCIVVAPDYRLSLDNPYPAGLNDCYDTLKWVKEHAEEVGGRADQIFVGGDSAGGGLTAAVCLMARDRGEVNIAFQLPIYPMIDDRQSNHSAVDNTMPIWSSKHNKVAWSLYLRDLVAAGEDIPIYAAPARADSYADLPPAVTYVGALDPFLDETKAYVAGLKAAGVPVQFRIFEGCYHGFDQVVPSADKSVEAFKFMTNAYAHAVDNYFAKQP